MTGSHDAARVVTAVRQPNLESPPRSGASNPVECQPIAAVSPGSSLYPACDVAGSGVWGMSRRKRFVSTARALGTRIASPYGRVARAGLKQRLDHGGVMPPVSATSCATGMPRKSESR